MDLTQEDLENILQIYKEPIREMGDIIKSLRKDLAEINSKLYKVSYREGTESGRIIKDKAEIKLIEELIERYRKGEDFTELAEDSYE